MEKQATNNNGSSGGLKDYWKLILGVVLLIAGLNSSSALVIAGIVLIALFFADFRKKKKEGEQAPEGTEGTIHPSSPSVGPLFMQSHGQSDDHAEEWVCGKCGAPNTGSVCKYCDSPREEKTE